MPQTTSSVSATSRKTAWFRFLRIALGIVLAWKGINFLRDTAAVQRLLGQHIVGELAKGDAALILIISAMTLLCGFLIMFGRFTRVASLVQLPVFLIGTLFIHGGHIERYGFELILTITIPFLLIIFITKDNYRFPEEQRKRTNKPLQR